MTPPAPVCSNDTTISQDGVTSRVLFIHGMGISYRSAPDTLLRSLSSELGLEQIKPAEAAPPDPQFDPNPLFVRPRPLCIHVDGASAPAELYVYRFRQTRRQGILSFTFVLWSPMTTDIKVQRLDAHELKAPALANDWAKQFINHYLSDVVLYGGTYRGVLRLGIEAALCYFVGGVPNEANPKQCNGGVSDIPTAVITHSLGAYMLMDAADDLSGDAGSPRLANNGGSQMLTSLNSFYWLANQLELLSLTTLTTYPPAQPVSAQKAAAVLRPIRSRFLQHWRQEHGRGPRAEAKREIVAFTDPNDILSYPVLSGDIDDPDVELRNFIIPNGEWNWFGLVANPFTAHLGYMSNDRVMDIIACRMSRGDDGACGG